MTSWDVRPLLHAARWLGVEAGELRLSGHRPGGVALAGRRDSNSEHAVACEGGGVARAGVGRGEHVGTRPARRAGGKRLRPGHIRSEQPHCHADNDQPRETAHPFPPLEKHLENHLAHWRMVFHVRRKAKQDRPRPQLTMSRAAGRTYRRGPAASAQLGPRLVAAAAAISRPLLRFAIAGAELARQQRPVGPCEQGLRCTAVGRVDGRSRPSTRPSCRRTERGSSGRAREQPASRRPRRPCSVRGPRTRHPLDTRPCPAGGRSPEACARRGGARRRRPRARDAR